MVCVVLQSGGYKLSALEIERELLSNHEVGTLHHIWRGLHCSLKKNVLWFVL